MLILVQPSRVMQSYTISFLLEVLQLIEDGSYYYHTVFFGSVLSFLVDPYLLIFFLSLMLHLLYYAYSTVLEAKSLHYFVSLKNLCP